MSSIATGKTALALEVADRLMADHEIPSLTPEEIEALGWLPLDHPVRPALTEIRRVWRATRQEMAAPGEGEPAVLALVREDPPVEQVMPTVLPAPAPTPKQTKPVPAKSKPTQPAGGQARRERVQEEKIREVLIFKFEDEAGKPTFLPILTEVGACPWLVGAVEGRVIEYRLNVLQNRLWTTHQEGGELFSQPSLQTAWNNRQRLIAILKPPARE